MPVVSDTFNRADSASLGTADSGQTWTTLAGGPRITTNQVAGLVGGNDVAHLDAGIADAETQITVATLGGDQGLWLRSTDVNNAFLAQLLNTNSVKLLRRQGGAYTEIGSASHTAAGGDVLKVRSVGSNWELFANGASKFTVSDSFQSGATKFGLRIDAAASRLDNFSVESLPSQLAAPFVGPVEVTFRRPVRVVVY